MQSGTLTVVRQKILILDDSPALRETLRTVLEGDYSVQTLTPAEYAHDNGKRLHQPDLIICSDAGGVPPLGAAVPVVWVTDRITGPPPGLVSGPWRILSRSFSPFQLRQLVAAMLAATSRPAGHRALQARLVPPFITREAAHIASHAARVRLPLLMYGEPGTGKRELAHAIHAEGGAGVFLPVAARSFAAHPLQVDPAIALGTLFLDGLELLDITGQERLRALLRPDGLVVTGAGVGLRLITAATSDLAELVDRGKFAHDLYYRIGVLRIRLPPLRDRTADLPALADQILRFLSGSLGLPPPALTPRATARLCNYMWFGNIAEFESVLARSLSLRRPLTLDAEDLLFETSQVVQESTAEDRPATVTRRLAGQAIELIANELAHEFKNPMVTIKTFAHHLQKMLQNEAGQEEVARLTGEAVDQMDRVLENLIEFTRLGQPNLQAVALATLLAEPLSQLARDLEQQGGRLACSSVPERAMVRVDPDQIGYAIENLFRAVSRMGGPGACLTVSFPALTALAVHLEGGQRGPGTHLAAMVGESPDSGASLPLGIAIAQVLIERNGGSLDLPHDGQIVRVCVTLAPAEQEEEVLSGNGSASRSDRG